MVFGLNAMEKKEEEEAEERRITKSKFHVCLSQLLYGVAELLGHFSNRLAKAFVCKCFGSLCCGY